MDGDLGKARRMPGCGQIDAAVGRSCDVPCVVPDELKLVGQRADRFSGELQTVLVQAAAGVQYGASESGDSVGGGQSGHLHAGAAVEEGHFLARQERVLHLRQASTQESQRKLLLLGHVLQIAGEPSQVDAVSAVQFVHGQQHCGASVGCVQCQSGQLLTRIPVGPRCIGDRSGPSRTGRV